MARPNKPRLIGTERALARRIAWERESRGWTYEGMAGRMTAAGCAIQASALYKIEKGTPRRRITVDELVAIAVVFEVDIPDLLLPVEVALHHDIALIASAQAEASQVLREAINQAIAATKELFDLYRRAEAEDNHELAAALDAWQDKNQQQMIHDSPLGLPALLRLHLLDDDAMTPEDRRELKILEAARELELTIFTVSSDAVWGSTDG